jgi:hypothetical protein
VCGWWYRERVQSQPCCQPGRATGRGARGEWQVRDKVNNTTHTHTPAHTRTPLRGPDSRKRRAKDQADARGAKENRRSRGTGRCRVRDIGPGSQDAREACESR